MTVSERVELIRELCSFEGRRAGSDAERRAAADLARRLRAAGRRAEVEPIHVHPRLGLIGALHCAGGIAASLLSLAVPAAGFALLLAVTVSMYLDLGGRLYLLRRLTFRRASQNVVSPGRRAEAPARVVLCAHYDAARTGIAYRAQRRRRAVRLLRALRLRPAPMRALFASLALLLVPLGALMAGLEGGWIAIVQLALTLALLAGAFLLLDIELSPVSPAANDNASGVATALSLAEDLDADPPGALDVWVVLCGAEEPFQEGMREFVRSHRRRLERESTYFLNLDAVGRGTPRFETRAGWVVSLAMGGRLAELCESIAAADRAGQDRFGARPLRRWTAGDSLPPRLARYRSITITARDDLDRVPELRTLADLPDAVEAEALERVHGFALELIRALDREAGQAGPTPRSPP